MEPVLLTGSVIVGGQTAETVTEAVTEAAQAAVETAGDAAGLFGSSGTFVWILYFVGMIALMYFIMYRPQKKKEKEMQEMQSAIKTGDWVMTSSGFYGKVADICDQVFIIEFGMNKGVRVPVAKSEVIGNKEPNIKSGNTGSEEKE
ncbi:MAG: preprotein translocase subunit YajC [Firmicutes bacterium]|nr:preprotein translocase subunit YajC [Bacillota bacterium]